MTPRGSPSPTASGAALENDTRSSKTGVLPPTAGSGKPSRGTIAIGTDGEALRLAPVRQAANDSAERMTVTSGSRPAFRAGRRGSDGVDGVRRSGSIHLEAAELEPGWSRIAISTIATRWAAVGSAVRLVGRDAGRDEQDALETERLTGFPAAAR